MTHRQEGLRAVVLQPTPQATVLLAFAARMEELRNQIMSGPTEDFRRVMLGLGIVSYREQETAWDIAKRCALTTGAPMAGAGFLMGLKAGTVTVPGVGTISGALAGFLAGLTTGTAICTAVNLSYRNELRKLLE
jgi:hypothetical protein